MSASCSVGKRDRHGRVDESGGSKRGLGRRGRGECWPKNSKRTSTRPFASLLPPSLPSLPLPTLRRALRGEGNQHGPKGSFQKTCLKEASLPQPATGAACTGSQDPPQGSRALC